MDCTGKIALYMAFPCTLAHPLYGPGQPYVADSPAKAAYVDAVGAELASLDDEMRRRPVCAVRLGGGASIMNADKVCRLVRNVRTVLNVEPRAEVAIEVNPLTVCTPSLTDWTSCGVNRIVLDVDSVRDVELSALGAAHTRGDVQNAFLFLSKFHMSRIDVRLRYGLPHQTSATWRQGLLTVADMGVEHVTVRPLAEPDPKKAAELPDRAVRTEMYRIACDVLGGQGYREYAVGMFVAPAAPHARDVYECALRTGADKLSLGAGSSSGYDGFLYENVSDFDFYVRNSSNFAAIARNPRREGETARRARLIEGALDLLETVRTDSLEPEVRSWIEDLVRAGRVERVEGKGSGGSSDAWRLTGLGRFERNEELGRGAML